MDFDPNAVDLEELDSSQRLGRRSFLMGALATGAAASAPINFAAAARNKRLPLAKDGRFDLGVASGFPRPRGITLWTRLDEVKRSSKLRVMVAKDPKFKNVVAEKLVTAREDRAFTARTFVKGLKPDERYYYRFFTEDSKSPVGRFKTAPPRDSRKPLRIAFYSCQNYEAGFYNVQRAIAKEKDLDLVICLGDYMYEYSDGGGGVRLDRSGSNRDGDTQTLAEYRQKYTLYKRDADLRAMHAAHPFISIWDDHEVEDNWAGDGPSSAGANPETQTNLKDLPRRVPFLQRRENGQRSFFNFHPRMRFKGERNRIYEDYRLGALVDLILTDERQYRDPQPCNDIILTPCPNSRDPRTMLGAQQKAWFKETMRLSPQRWKLWGTEVMLMGIEAPPGESVIQDSWDGYAHEREELLAYLLDNGVENTVALTGDIHTFFAGTATTSGNELPGHRKVLPEFVGGSATSAGVKEATGLNDGAVQVLAALNTHVDFYDVDNKGYGLVEISDSEVTCEFKAPAGGVKTRNGGATTSLAKFRVGSGERSPTRIA